MKVLVLDYYGVLAHHKSGGWQLNRELINLLMNLKKRAKIVLVSNTYAKSAAELNPKLDAGLFDLILLAGATGLWKPDVLVYETIIGKFDIPPNKYLIVDDNQNHLDAAASLGLKTHLYKDNLHFKAELEKFL